MIISTNNVQLYTILYRCHSLKLKYQTFFIFYISIIRIYNVDDDDSPFFVSKSLIIISMHVASTWY